jgi:hypothetical protein
MLSTETTAQNSYEVYFFISIDDRSSYQLKYDASKQFDYGCSKVQRKAFLCGFWSYIAWYGSNPT